LEGHPSTRRAPSTFSSIKVDARDWSNLLRVSVVAKSMLACIILYEKVDVGICEGHALVLYVYITDEVSGEGPVVTYYIPAHD